MKNYPEIVVQKQPNGHTCYPTCVSILTGIPLDKILETIGYDKSKTNGISREEMALSALLLGWSLIDISGFDFSSLIDKLSKETISYRMILSYKRYKHYHAVAWDGKSKFVIDPLRDKLILLNKIKDKIRYIEALLPVEKRKQIFLQEDIAGFKSI